MRRHQTPLQIPNINRFHRELAEMSVDTETLYNELGIDPELMQSENSSLSRCEFHELFELAAEQSGQRFLGIKMGFRSQPGDFGVLGYMLRNAPNLEKAMDLLHRYVSLVSPGSSISLLQEGRQQILTFKIQNTPPSQCCQSIEMSLTQYVLMIQELLQDDSWQPERIYFEHQAPDKDLLETIPLGGELIFDHYFSGVCIPRELLHLPNNESDPQLLALLESQVLETLENHLHNSDSLLDHIRLLISSNLGHKAITADSVAAEIGMSRRTLHRRLQENGTTFNTLREDVVLKIAKESLSGTRVSITELALQLGYSDSSAFDRAFKRLTGKSPLAYRKQRKTA